jgi:signal transduction histidine kinase/DNA-binding response OmpR family regulator
MRIFKFFLFGCLLLQLILGGCGAEEKRKFRVGFSQCTMFDDWRKAMVNEMSRELIFYDDIEFILKDAEGDNEKQISQIEELIDQHVDLLIVSPNEAEPITKTVEKVFSKGIPVVILDRKINSSSYTSYVGADNRYIGETVGRYAANLLKGKSNVIELWGLKGSTPFIERDQGFRHVMSQYSGVKVTIVEGDWGQKRDAEAAFKQLLNSSGDYDLVFAQNDIMALAAHEVYQKMNRPKKLNFIGIDGLAGPGGGMENVANGTLKATALYPTGGDKAIQVASDILRRRSFERENLLKTVMIDSSNVFVMQMQADKILNQQKDILRQEVKNSEQIQVYNSQRRLVHFLLASLVVLVIVSGIAIISWRDKIDINRKLTSKSQEIVEQRDTIAEMARQAEIAIQEKLRFFTNISHEFKTPLALILGPAESLLQSAEFKDRSREYVVLIKKNAARLLLLINQLMDFRKIEEKRMRVHVSEIDLVQFIRDIMIPFDNVAKMRKIQFLLNANVDPLKVWIDPNIYDKVIFNLLSNAFNFTHDRGKINISISLDNEEWNALIVVEDNGEGMSKESVQHAFDRFYTHESVGGTGLGLSLSKELIEAHHGEIVLTSEKGNGTRFCIVQPLGNAHFEESQIQRAPTMHKTNPHLEFLDDYEVPYETLMSAPATFDKHYTILIIEDHKELRAFLKNELTPYYNIEEATEGLEGLRLAFEIVPDIVICDVMIPGKDGYEVTRTLKTDVRTSHIPVIILTAKGAIEQKIVGIKTGADDYITKPFVFELLHQRIQAIIKGREVLKEHYSQEVSLTPQLNTPGALDKKFLNDFRALVEKNIDNAEFNVNDIGPELGMSRIQVYRKVKALMDCSINDYIINVRLKRAKYLLLTTDKSVAEISTEVGFSSPNYFSTTFKTKFNLSPKDFKQTQSGK